MWPYGWCKLLTVISSWYLMITLGGFKNHDTVERERLMQMMNVPDRIVLTGGDGYKGYEAQPLELMNDHINQVGENDLKDLPNKITLKESPYLDRGDPAAADEPVRSENSIAIEENPLQELKLMRRQIGRISTRLYQLEDEIEQRRFRDKVCVLALLNVTEP
ncbi:unnamed protein product [Strongylus vulgaris]|uniref:Mitochondrial fission factor n=1 Tax=Strongylus vulgaris TaxID=40348 RepID=A0A3P7LFP2_STRVU|nr:unnamed protein product [Strongylus vulgaris]